MASVSVLGFSAGGFCLVRELNKPRGTEAEAVSCFGAVSDGF